MNHWTVAPQDVAWLVAAGLGVAALILALATPRGRAALAGAGLRLLGLLLARLESWLASRR